MKEQARLTLDMSRQEHSYLKMASAKLGISMREFILLAAFEKLIEVEDEWLSSQAREVLVRIKEGNEKLSSWKAVKKRI